jgi:hypothetical protein
MTLSVKGLLNVTLGINDFSITMLCHYAECHYSEYLILFMIMLIVIMLNAVMLNVVMLSVMPSWKAWV